MKKCLTLLLCAAALFGLCACRAETEPAAEESLEAVAAEEVSVAEEILSETEEPESPVSLRIYSLKGPTSMGLVNLYKENEAGTGQNTYEVSIVTAADEVTAALISGDADIAALPANAAATLYNKAGGFSVVAINTLGVLSIVENGTEIQSFEDLAGKTIVLTGKGTTPEYAMNYLLDAYGLTDSVTLEFKAEAAEVVSYLAEDGAAVGLLPQPFVTSALLQNENLRIALDLTEEWEKVSEDSTLVTGVTVVRTELLEEHPEQVADFLEEYAASVQAAEEDPEGTAALIEEYGIVAKAAIARQALPYCHICCITGEEMRELLSGYLNTLDGLSVDDGFYYIP